MAALISRTDRFRLRAAFARPFLLLNLRFPRIRLLATLAEQLAFVRSVYGVRILNTPGDRTFELCATGYGPFVADTIAGFRGSFVFLDIGANLGLFGLLAARNPDCRRVVAFEPVPGTFDILCRNIAHNGADIVQPVRGAIFSSALPTIPMTYAPIHSGMSKVTDCASGAVDVPVITAPMLDEIVGAPQTIVAKIDVEGAEPEVLSVLKATGFWFSIRDIIIEISLRNLGDRRRSDVHGFLAAEGFRETARRGSDDHYDAHFTRTSPVNASL
jgi:FkbM family methyltransferase